MLKKEGEYHAANKIIDQFCILDIDECSTHKNDCGYKGGCKNTVGSFTCSCLSGYYLDVDGKTCKGNEEKFLSSFYTET